MKDSSKKVIWRTVGIVLSIVAVVCLVLLFLSFHGCEGDIIKYKNPWGKDTTTNGIVTLPGVDPPPETTQDTSNVTAEESEPVETEPPIITGETPEEVSADYEVDFASMYDINPDIHAWIEIPGTPIDYPVLQSPTSDLYYERRSYTGAYSVSGCIFTQYYNHTDFSDRNTILYGHYMLDGTFFGSLHNYKDPAFFEKNRYIYITIPGHILVYDIFAAYEFDNRHILGSYNFSDDEKYLEYLEGCLNPSTMVRNVRAGVELGVDDKIITLSTCTSYYTASSGRYLVQGVLVADVETD